MLGSSEVSWNADLERRLPAFICGPCMQISTRCEEPSERPARMHSTRSLKRSMNVSVNVSTGVFTDSHDTTGIADFPYIGDVKRKDREVLPLLVLSCTFCYPDWVPFSDTFVYLFLCRECRMKFNHSDFQKWIRKVNTPVHFLTQESLLKGKKSLTFSVL